LVGPENASQVLADRAQPLTAALQTAVGPKAAEIAEVRPWLVSGAPTVEVALERIARRMDFGYERAVSLFSRIEPDLDVANVAGGFAGRLADLAVAEWEFFGRQSYNPAGTKTVQGHTETEARLPPGSGEDWFARVGRYWSEGVDIQGVNGKTTSKPWSAAFISWLVEKAGAGKAFRGSPRHAHYIGQAIRDFLDKADVAYWCQRLPDHVPAVGDIVCWAREPGVDYDHQKGGEYDGHCDVVVEVRSGEVDVIGGNVGHSVSRRTLLLDANGRLRPINLHGESLFAIMANRLS
jgi:hypothetical protein